MNGIKELKTLSHEDEWIIHNFDCGYSNNPPFKSFEFIFYNEMRLEGTLSIGGIECRDKYCVLQLNCSSSIWEVRCSFRITGCKKEFDCILNQKNPRYQFYLLDSNNRCAFKSTSKRITYKIDWVTIPVFSITDSKFYFDYNQLFESKKYWDVTFEVGDREIHANKCILACRSRVFEAMFESELSESKSNKVKIEDMGPGAFEEMLRYIYTDTAPNVKQFASELLSASDKYDLEKLKSMAAKELAANIAIENAADVLILADLHRANQLKYYVMDFIASNKHKVAETEGWQQLISEYPALLAELYLRA